MDLAVVVPAHNEETQLDGLLDSLAAQTDLDFTLILVDNASTDDTARIARRFAAPFPVHVVYEPERGVGPALDTGFRYAINLGAQRLLRTDAYCRPASRWVATARKLLTGQVDAVRA